MLARVPCTGIGATWHRAWPSGCLTSDLRPGHRGQLGDEPGVCALHVVSQQHQGAIPSTHHHIACWCQHQGRRALLQLPLGGAAVAQQLTVQIHLQGWGVVRSPWLARSHCCWHWAAAGAGVHPCSGQAQAPPCGTQKFTSACCYAVSSPSSQTTCHPPQPAPGAWNMAVSAKGAPPSCGQLRTCSTTCNVNMQQQADCRTLLLSMQLVQCTDSASMNRALAAPSDCS